MKRIVLLFLVFSIISTSGVQPFTCVANNILGKRVKISKHDEHKHQKTGMMAKHNVSSEIGDDVYNHLTNGNFEEWSDGVPTGWKSTSMASSATLSQSTDAHGGLYAVNINGNKSSNVRLATQEMRLPAGTYTFSFWAKATTTDVSQARPGYVPVIDDKTGNFIYGDYITLSKNWQQIDYKFTLDSTTTICLVVMNPKASMYSSGKDILIDDAFFGGSNIRLKEDIHVDSAGTLSNYIKPNKKYIIEELTLSGQLNGLDFQLLRDMAGNNSKGKKTNGVLKVLDLSAVKIKSGGGKYIDAEWICGMVGGQLEIQEDIIGEKLFAGCSSLQKIILPKDAMKIESGAFAMCSNLTSIIIGDKVMSIGNSCFKDCHNIENINLSTKLKHLGDSTFQNCYKLKSIVIPDSVNSIGKNLLENCSMLSSIELPNSITTIGSSAFQECSNLQSIIIPNNVTAIGSSAFSGCRCLTSVCIPSSVTSLECLLFSNCYSLTSVTIPNSVTSFGYGVFSGCI